MKSNVGEMKEWSEEKTEESKDRAGRKVLFSRLCRTVGAKYKCDFTRTVEEGTVKGDMLDLYLTFKISKYIKYSSELFFFFCHKLLFLVKLFFI